MHLIYIDDSADEKLAIYSALALPADQWREAFNMMRQYRRGLRRAYGIYVYKELHAWKFVSGRGDIADRVVTKHQRVSVFNEILDLMARLPGARLFNAVFPKAGQMTAFERMVNRVNRTLQAWGSHGILICDQGNELSYIRLVRRMGVFNPIPSNQGIWQDTGANWRNYPIDRIVEDPFFKSSDQSYFIQLCDFAAYALLRRENPLASKSRYGLHESFDHLKPILVREARPRDPDGIIRP
jgi:hypothetical protein